MKDSIFPFLIAIGKVSRGNLKNIIFQIIRINSWLVWTDCLHYVSGHQSFLDRMFKNGGGYNKQRCRMCGHTATAGRGTLKQRGTFWLWLSADQLKYQQNDKWREISADFVWQFDKKRVDWCYIKLFYRANILLLQDSWIINLLGPAKSNLTRKDVTILDNALKLMHHFNLLPFGIFLGTFFKEAFLSIERVGWGTFKHSASLHNRVAEIVDTMSEMRKYCQVEDLQYVSGELNPADLATRGNVNVEDFGRNS